MRLGTSLATGSATHNLTFSYDRYGNMTCSTNQNTNGPCPSYTFNASTNQISNSGYTYDAAGDLTADGTGTGTHTYQFDAENRLKSIDNGATATYTYNALGQRVEKNVAGTYTEYVRHPSGSEVGENNRSSWMQIIPLRGRHIAHYNNGAYFNHSNNLGTTSHVTDHTGAVAQDQLYYPWGQKQTMIGTTQEKRFAKLRHRDTTETGLDPTQFRMFSSTQGRWLSKDPVSGRACSPQSMNVYAYVHNNPGNAVDPRGDFPICPHSGFLGDPLMGGGCEPWDASCGGDLPPLCDPVFGCEGSGGGFGVCAGLFFVPQITERTSRYSIRCNCTRKDLRPTLGISCKYSCNCGDVEQYGCSNNHPEIPVNWGMLEAQYRADYKTNPRNCPSQVRFDGTVIVTTVVINLFLHTEITGCGYHADKLTYVSRDN